MLPVEFIINKAFSQWTLIMCRIYTPQQKETARSFHFIKERMGCESNELLQSNSALGTLVKLNR